MRSSQPDEPYRFASSWDATGPVLASRSPTQARRREAKATFPSPSSAQPSDIPHRGRSGEAFVEIAAGSLCETRRFRPVLAATMAWQRRREPSTRCNSPAASSCAAPCTYTATDCEPTSKDERCCLLTTRLHAPNSLVARTERAAAVRLLHRRLARGPARGLLGVGCVRSADGRLRRRMRTEHGAGSLTSRRRGRASSVLEGLGEDRPPA